MKRSAQYDWIGLFAGKKPIKPLNHLSLDRLNAYKNFFLEIMTGMLVYKWKKTP